MKIIYSALLFTGVISSQALASSSNQPFGNGDFSEDDALKRAIALSLKDNNTTTSHSLKDLQQKAADTGITSYKKLSEFGYVNSQEVAETLWNDPEFLRLLNIHNADKNKNWEVTYKTFMDYVSKTQKSK